MSNFIISLDSGTTSARAVLFETTGEVHAIEQKEFTQIYPESGWVEHDPLEILKAQASRFLAIDYRIKTTTGRYRDKHFVACSKVSGGM